MRFILEPVSTIISTTWHFMSASLALAQCRDASNSASLHITKFYSKSLTEPYWVICDRTPSNMLPKNPLYFTQANTQAKAIALVSLRAEYLNFLRNNSYSLFT
jgi:hypothetical protein